MTDLTVACSDPKKRVLGGGYENPDLRGTNNTVIASFPSADNRWTVRIFNPSGSTTFNVRPYAICAMVAQ
jgi:hypothetical protein